jgi:hypothetical protein
MSPAFQFTEHFLLLHSWDGNYLIPILAICLGVKRLGPYEMSLWLYLHAEFISSPMRCP